MFYVKMNPDDVSTHKNLKHIKLYSNLKNPKMEFSINDYVKQVFQNYKLLFYLCINKK